MSAAPVPLPPKIIPVIAPDGTSGQVPADNAQAAINAGGKLGIKVYAPDGTLGTIPVDQLPAALKAGGVTQAQHQVNINAAPPDPNQSGALNSGMRFLEGAGSAIADAGKGIYNAVTAPRTPGLAGALQSLAPGGTLGYRLLVQPQIAAGQQAVSDARNGNYSQMVGHGLAAITPVAGPGAAGIADAAVPAIEQGNYAGALGSIGANVGLAALLKKASTGIAGESNVPGENYTPTQLKAHSGILGRMNGLGDNFIPQDSAANTGSVIRQAAADNPSLAQAATVKGSTPTNIAALQAILQKANTNLEIPHAATIAQNANVPADVSGVQAAVGQSFPSSLSGVSPEDAAAIQQLQGRLGTINTLGGLNDLRQWLNDEAAAGYKQDGVAAARGTATKAGIRTAADAARDAYYDQLQQASGVDFRPLKEQQSNLLDQQEGAAKLGQTLSAQQAVSDEPKSPMARAGETLTGGRALKAGPLAGAAQLAAEKLLGQTPLTQPNYLIRRFLSDLPQPTPQAVQDVSAPPEQPNIAGNLPANSTPPTIQGTPVPSSPAPPPQLNLPSYPQLQLPAGVEPRFLQQMASPGEPTPPVPPYPALNDATARTRIAPTRFASPEVIPPSGARPVTPSGTVMTPIQRFLQAGDLGNSIVEPSVDDLKRAISNMRNKRGK